MIDGYKCRDGKVIVINYDSDNNVTEEEREYQDNIEELLKAENIEEHLDKLKDKYVQNIEKCERIINDAGINIFNSVMIIGFFSLFFGIMLGIPFSSFIPFIVSFLGLGSIMGFGLIIPSIRNSRRAKKDINGSELVLEGINEEIQKNQRDLRRLRNDTRIEKEDISSEYKQFDLKPLEELEEYLKIWEYIGENEKYYVFEMNHGMLEKGFEDDFDESQVKALKRVLSKRNSK